MAHRLLAPLLCVAILLGSLAVAAPHSGGGHARAAASGTPDAGACPAPAGFSDSGVTVELAKSAAPGDVVSFGLPLPRGAVRDASTLAVTRDGTAVPASVAVLLRDYDPDGEPAGVRSVLVQIPSSALTGSCATIEIAWQGGGVTVTDKPVPYAMTSAPSDETVDQADYTIAQQNGAAALTAIDRQRRVLFTSREPAVLATFPSGYLGATGILGELLAANDLGPSLAGLQFISDAVTPFGLSAMYAESYPVNAAMVVDPTDPENGYEGWLYDRCATFLAFYIHTGDARFLREGYRLCTYYADHIELTGENRGIFTGKPEPDPKYSHLRGLYAYYALTGDVAAMAAGTAMAEMIAADQSFVAPYLAGHNTAPDHLWTERLLAVSIEALYFGHLFTGDVAYLNATSQLVATAYRHITGNAADLAAIDPGTPAFPPQNCFIHTAAQAAEGDADQPWCSGWMPALLVAPLLAYQEQTGDPKVDEIFIRLTRYLRDTGTAYFTDTNANENDTFMQPSVPSAAPDAEDQRLLVPLYGAGIGVDGKRANFGEFDDYEHCLDATAITAAGIRSLKRTGGFDVNPIGPFASEGDSFLALHEEFAFCAAWTLAHDARPHRDPATWTGPDAAAELATGLSDPAGFIADNNIANVSHNVSPRRKISWWFNESLEDFALLREAGVDMPALHVGVIQSGAAKPTAFPTLVVATATGAAGASPTPPSTATAPTETPAAPIAAPATPVEGGGAATGSGEIVYIVYGGPVYRVAAQAGATPENISAKLDQIAPIATPYTPGQTQFDNWAGVSPNGKWLLLMTERFDPDCYGWPCLVVMPSDLSAAEPVKIDGQVLHADGTAAISSDGNTIVFVNTGGPHQYDLWATTRQSGGWSAPALLSKDSPYLFHGEPALSADGGKVMFDCGDHQYMVDNTAICEVGLDGSGFRVVITPADGPAGSDPHAALRHPGYAPDGGIVFEGDWFGGDIWRIPPGGKEAELVTIPTGSDFLPCALPDGRIASLFTGRPGNSESHHELMVMTADGMAYVFLVVDEHGQDIEDISCGG